jgi:hypothetical protein
LSLAGEIPLGRGVGVGEGFCAKDTVGFVPKLVTRRTFEPPAMTKLFNNRPATHARAHILTAAVFWGVLGIIPSSGISLNGRHALRSKCKEESI